MNKKTIIFFMFIANLMVGLGLYGKSLSYSFVFDDHTKIVRNPIFDHPKNVIRSFWNRDVQSQNPLLNTHTFRPVLYVCLSVDHWMWGLHPSGYRLKNILFHVINATLVAVLALLMFSVSPLSAFLAGLLFLVHPAQVESVAWIIERSNLLAGLFMLLAVLGWHFFKAHRRRRWLVFSVASTVLGLLSRETMIVMPLLILFLSIPEETAKESDSPPRFTKYVAVYFLIVMGYILYRTWVLGRVAQSPYWGGSVLKNGVVVARVWETALQFLLIPYPQTIYHTLSALDQPLSRDSLMAMAILLIWLGLMMWGIVKRDPAGILMAVISLCWFPTSQIIPVANIFSERFLYPVLIGAAWLVSIGLEKLQRTMRLGLALTVILSFSFLTSRYIPVWRNDVTLWAHAVEQDPSQWTNWYHLAEAEKVMAWMASHVYLRPEPLGWIDRAEYAYQQSLHCQFPSEFGGIIFLNLAEINLMQGKIKEANEHARRGLALRPDLIGLWDLKKKAAGR